MHALVEEARRIIIGLGLHVLAEGERHRPALGRIGQDRDRPSQRWHDLLGARDPIEIARHGLKAVIGAHRSVAEVLDLLQNGIRPTVGEHVARDQQHGQPIDMRERGGGDHVGRARADRSGAGHHPPAARGLGEGDCGMRHRLLVVGAIGREGVARGEQRLSHAGHIAMAEDGEYALEQALLQPVDFDLLGAQEANHRLGCGQPNRCHGAHFLGSIIVHRLAVLRSPPPASFAPRPKRATDRPIAQMSQPFARSPRGHRCGRRTTPPPARRRSCARPRSL